MFISQPMSDRAPAHLIARAKGGALLPPLAPCLPAYPLGCFPGLLGKLAHNLSAGGTVAPEIVGTALIPYASLLTQGIADVTWPNGQTISIGSNGIVAAPPGSGKSFVCNRLSQPIEKYLAADTPGRESCQLLMEDATREAIVQSLHEWPVAGLLTDEAGMLSSLQKDAPTLVKLLDGSPLRNARVSTGRVALSGQRFSMLLMEQPEIFEETKRLLGAGRGGVGLINRFYIAQANDFRPGNSLHSVGLLADVAYAYETRALELLVEVVEVVKQGIQERPKLKLSSEACQRLIRLDRDARRHCTPDSPWFFVSEYIFRHAERVLRLAGVFHVFEYGAEGEISLDTLQRAECLGDWYVESFAQIFYEPPKQTQAEVDADDLEMALIQACRFTGNSVFRQSEMRTHALNFGLTQTRFTRALAVLCKQGRAWVSSYQNKPWISLNVTRLSQF